MEKTKEFIKKNWLFILAIIYFVVPTDLFPDFVPALGKTDDLFLFILEGLRRIKETSDNEKA